jgi:hypothetical protein
LGSGGDIIVPSSVFFPSRVAALSVTRIDPRAFRSTRITSILISPHVQILCSECFSDCNSLSSISFETKSELTHIESRVFVSTCLSLVVSQGVRRSLPGMHFRSLALSRSLGQIAMQNSEPGISITSSARAKDIRDGKIVNEGVGR